jgi:cysteine synthase A
MSNVLSTAAQQFMRSVGNTPLIEIKPGLYGKLETANPTGSVKDRMIAYVVTQAISRGEIKPTTLLVEATSGNTGIALSALGAAMGNPVQIIMPGNMSEERKQMMRAFGANIYEVANSDFDAAIQKRNEILTTVDDSWSPFQFENKDNIRCHREKTAPEIYDQLPALTDWSAFVSGSGTGGTIMGIKGFIDHRNLQTKIVMVRPKEDLHGIQGIGDGEDFLATPDQFDDIIEIATEDAKERAKRLAMENGLLVGISAAANVLAAEIWIEKYKPSGNVITMLCDRGERYLSLVW